MTSTNRASKKSKTTVHQGEEAMRTKSNSTATSAKKSKTTVHRGEEPMSTTSKRTNETSEKSNEATVDPSASPAPTTATTSASVRASPSTDAAQCKALLDQIDAVLGPVQELSNDDIRRSLKLRKGGAQVVTDLLALCAHHGVTSVGSITPSTMSALKARADVLNQIGVQFAAVGKKLSDGAFSAESQTWQQATTLYTVLQRLSLMNPTLAEGLEPVQDFFQTKKTKGKKRATEENARLRDAEKPIAKREAASPDAGSGPAPSSSSGAPAAGGTPVVAPAAPNGVTHS